METSSKDCPFCKLANPASAQVCDCGYRFTGSVADPYQMKMLLEGRAKILIKTGMVILSLGLARTIMNSLAAFVFGHEINIFFFCVLILIGVALLIMWVRTKIKIKKLGI